MIDTTALACRLQHPPPQGSALDSTASISKQAKQFYYYKEASYYLPKLQAVAMSSPNEATLNTSTSTATTTDTAAATNAATTTSRNDDEFYYVRKPEKHDVLCGRGGATNSHQGNVRYRTLVQAHQNEYLHAAKSEKKEVARSIVSIIRSSGGGFLRKCDDGRVGWVDIGCKKAREKVSQALREGLDAKTLLATKGINKADLMQAIAAEGPPSKRRRRTSDADVASSEARGCGGGGGTGTPSKAAAMMAGGALDHVKEPEQQHYLDAEVAATENAAAAATLAQTEDASISFGSSNKNPAEKETASPELIAEAAPAYYDYGDMFGYCNGLFDTATAHLSGGYYLGGGFYSATTGSATGVIGGAPAGSRSTSTSTDAGGTSTDAVGFYYGTDETDLYASGARRYNVPPPPTAADCTDIAQV